jgi:hypothetical protein
MPPKYDETTDIELQSHNPTTSTRAPGQLKSGSEHEIQSEAPTASSSRRTTDLPETLINLRHALKHLRREIATKDAKLRSETFTRDTQHRAIDHELRSKVREWVEGSVQRAQTDFRPTLPPLFPGLDRFLKGRAGSARLVRDEAESIARETGDSIAIKTIPGGERREGDKVMIKEVIVSWGRSV